MEIFLNLFGKTVYEQINPNSIDLINTNINDSDVNNTHMNNVNNVNNTHVNNVNNTHMNNVNDKTTGMNDINITKIKDRERMIGDENNNENISIIYANENTNKEKKIFKIEENYFELKDQSVLEKKYHELDIKYQILERKLNENTDIIKKYSVMEDKINKFMLVFEKDNYNKLMETTMRLNDRISKIENDIFDIFDLIGDCDDQFQQLFARVMNKKEIRSLKSQIENIVLELSSIKSSLADNKNQLISHDTIVNDHTTTINTLHTHLDNLNSNISSELSCSDSSSFKSTIHLLNCQIKELKQELSDIKFFLSSKSNLNQSDFIRSFNLALRSGSAVPFVPQHTSIYPFDSSQVSYINKTNAPH